MKTKKVLAVLLSGALLGQTLALAACNGNKDPFGNEGDKEGKYNITVGYMDADGGKVVLDALKKSYEAKHTDVNIKLKSYGDSFDTFMNQNWGNQSNLPDILWMPDNEFAGWASGGHFLDLRSFYESSAETSYDLYYNTMLNCASYTGEFKPLSESNSAEYGLYFAPRDYNKIVVAINRDLFESYGVDVPDTSNGWTMNEFFALCDEINEKITARVNAGGSDALEATSNSAVYFQLASEVVYTTMFHAMGSDGIIDDNGNLVLDNATNSSILDSFYDNLTNSDYKLSTNASDFERGLCFMRCIVRPTAVDLKDDLDNMDFLPFPAKTESGEVKIGTGCSGYGIAKVHAEEVRTVNGVSKKVKDLAWDFIKYVITEEGQEVAGETGLSVPVMKSLADSGKWRSAIGTSLNHDAFMAGDELILDTYNVFDPQKRNTLRPFIVSFFNAMSNKANGNKADGSRKKFLTACVDQFNLAKK